MKQFQRIVTILLLALFALQICAEEEKSHDHKSMTVTLNGEQTKTAIEQPYQSQTSKDNSIEENEKKKENLVDEMSKEVSKAEKSEEEKHKEDNHKEEAPKQDNLIEEKPKEEKSKEDEHKDEKPKEEIAKEEKPKEEKPEGDVSNTKVSEDEALKKDNSGEHKEDSVEGNETKSAEKKSGPTEKYNKGNFHKNESGDEHGEENSIEESMHEHDAFGSGIYHDDNDIPFEGYMGEEIDQYLGDDHPGSRFEEEDQTIAPANTTAEDEAIVADAANKTLAAAPSGPRPPVPQATGCKTQGQIALTYSEGPSDVTAKIVRQLTKAEARANFFVNATWLYTQQYAMVVQNIYNAGHFIGMTYRVPNDDPASISDDGLRQDIINSAHTIETLINVSPKYVRLHYTEVKDVRTESILQDLGFVIVGYNLDSLDYFKKDATGPGSINQIYEDTFVKYKDTYDAKGSFISIQYDLPYTGSLAAIPHVINTIDKEGYTMVRLDGCLNDAAPYKKSANGTEYVSDKFSFGQSGYRQGQKSVEIETAAQAAEADENFNIQGLMASKASAYEISISVFLVVVGAAFTLFM